MKKFFFALFFVSWMLNLTYAYAPTHANQTSKNSTNESIGILSANEPIYREMIADGPWRVEPSQQKVPIYVLVKDAGEDIHNPAYYLDHVEIWADGRHLMDKYYGITIGGTQYQLPSGKGEWLYNYGDWYDTIMLDKSGYDVNGQWYSLSGKVNFQVWVKDGLFSNWDSYFETYFSPYTLPHLSNWYAGDTHYHSSYSDNFVEFGGPINTTVKMGKVIGIDWTVITDHSFDLDDKRSIFDPSNHKWTHLKNEFNKFQNDPTFKVILGEEISAGNGHTNPQYTSYDSENVHLLCYNLTSLNSYIQGDGDDRGDHLGTYPTITLQDAITQCNNAGGFAYAGHPGAISNDTLFWLNRGGWFDDNVNTLYNLQGWAGLQIWNTIRDDWSFFEDGKILWLNQLRQGRKSFIASGSDAHGDFSNASYFEPSFPDLDGGEVVFHNSSFARVRTYVYTTDFSQNGILNALRNGNSIMTDGPLVTFTVYDYVNLKEEIIGNTLNVSRDTNIEINIRGASSDEFGKWIDYTIYYGVIGGSETPVKSGSFYASPTGLGVEYINIRDYPIYNQNGYFRIEATTNAGYRAYTNPIWVEVLPSDTTPPTTPSLLSPSSGYLTNNPAISFSWTAASDSDSGVKDYQIQIDNNNDFSSPERDVYVASTSYSTSLSDNVYYWRVRARDNANNLGSFTSPWSFTIDSTPPTVTVISPNGGENWQAGTSQLIRWTASDNIGVTAIELYYSTEFLENKIITTNRIIRLEV